MQAFSTIFFRVLSLLSAAAILLLSACKPAPSLQTVNDLVTNHFETEKYHVVALDIGSIISLSPGEKTYMGTPGYFIEIQSITIEMRQDIGSPVLYRKGQQVTFTNARIHIREHPGQTEKWTITGISGIPLP